MSWQEPKTNWKAGDSPSSSDFNRIEGNIDYVKENACKVETVNNKLPDENKNVNIGLSDIPVFGRYDDNLKEFYERLEENTLFDRNRARTIYLNATTGNDNNDGAFGRPVKTLFRAIELLPLISTGDLSIRIDTDITIPSISESGFHRLEKITAPRVSILGYGNTITVVNNVGIDFYNINGNLEISNFTINMGAAGVTALDISGCKNVNISKVTINGHGDTREAIRIFRTGNAHLSEVKITNASTGIEVERSTVGVISSNISVRSSGICIEADYNAIVTSNLNTFTGGTDYEANRGSQVFTKGTVHL